MVKTIPDLLTLLDNKFDKRKPDFWVRFYENRSAPVPFFIDAPDENLVELVENRRILPGKVLDIGCGPGRNTLYLQSCGFSATGVDFSPTAIAWAKERNADRGLYAHFVNDSIFQIDLQSEAYDVIYDAGLLHHIPPHRRADYLTLVSGCLKPGGLFGLVCFNALGGNVLTDDEIYSQWSLKGGLAFSRDQIEQLFSEDFEMLETRPMRSVEKVGGQTVFGKDFLDTYLLRKR